MLINIYGAHLVSSVLSGVLLECGHSPFHTGLEASPWQMHRGTLGLWLHCWGELTSGLIFLSPGMSECRHPPLTLDGKRMYSYCHLTIGLPGGQVQPAA